MSLLDDAKRLAEQDAFYSDPCPDGCCSSAECVFGCQNDGRKHGPDCPWLSLPRIVAALEASERLTELIPPMYAQHVEDVREKVDGSGTYSWCQSCDESWPCAMSEIIKRNGALVMALKGEEVTA